MNVNDFDLLISLAKRYWLPILILWFSFFVLCLAFFSEYSLSCFHLIILNSKAATFTFAFFSYFYNCWNLVNIFSFTVGKDVLSFRYPGPLGFVL